MITSEDFEEWLFDKTDPKTGQFPNIFYSILARLWFIPHNFIDKWYYRIFVRGKCAIKGCEEHYSCGGNLPDDVCEWYCKRCNAEGINHIVYTHEFFYPDTPVHNFKEALRGR